MTPDTAVDRVLNGWSASARPPTYREFANRITLSGGRLAGHKYDPATDPAQDYLCSQIDSGRWERIYVCAPPQIGGKTQLCILTVGLRDAIGMGAPVGYGLPTLADLDRSWAQKLKPSIIGGGYGDWLPKQGPGAKGGRGPTLTLYNPTTGQRVGQFVFMAGGAYSSTVRTVLVDEVDQFRAANGEPLWSGLEDMFHRADSYGRSATRIAVGTIEHDESSIILALIDDHGTGTRFWPMCVHCGQHHQYSWDTFAYDATDDISAIETAHIACTGCGAKINDNERVEGLQSMIACHAGQSVDGGKVIGPEPRKTGLGLLWTALESSLVTLGEVALEHKKASDELQNHGQHALMRKFTRYRKCIVYLDDVQDELKDVQHISEEHMERLSQFGWSDYLHDKDTRRHSRHYVETMPVDFNSLSIGCDVQADRIYWQVTAWADGLRSFDVGHGYEHIGSAGSKLRQFAPGDWKTVLERIRDEVLPLFGQKEWTCKVCDVGFQADEICRFLKENPDWNAIFGRKTLPNRSKTMKICAQNQLNWSKSYRPGVGSYIVADSPAMQTMQARYIREPGKPGSAAIGSGMNRNNAYIMHLTSWQWVDGKYRQVRTRDDWADCKKYQTAVALYRLGAYMSITPKRRKRRVAGVFKGGRPI